MKKLFALLLALCMILALTACGGAKNDVAGTWVGTVDAARYIIEDAPEMKDYLKSAPVSITLELTADGHYTLNSDGTTMIPAFKEAMRGYMQELIQQEGITVEAFEAQTQKTLDEFIDGMVGEMELGDLTESVSGLYTAADGKITFDPGQDVQVDGTWAGDSMSFDIDIGSVTLTRK